MELFSILYIHIEETNCNAVYFRHTSQFHIRNMTDIEQAKVVHHAPKKSVECLHRSCMKMRSDQKKKEKENLFYFILVRANWTTGVLREELALLDSLSK